MNQKELEKQFAEKSREQQLETLKANKTRAQSITIGTAGGGGGGGASYNGNGTSGYSNACSAGLGGASPQGAKWSGS